VVTTAERADDGVLWAAAELYGVAKGMATVALFDEREGVKKFNDTWAAEEEEGS